MHVRVSKYQVPRLGAEPVLLDAVLGSLVHGSTCLPTPWGPIPVQHHALPQDACCLVRGINPTFFCSGLPAQGSGGSAKLLGPVACCSSLAAATKRADSWPVVMPHLLNNQQGCLASFAAAGGATISTLEAWERMATAAAPIRQTSTCLKGNVTIQTLFGSLKTWPCQFGLREGANSK